MLKRVLSLASRNAAVSGFVKLLEQVPAARANLLAVLTYHRVDEPSARPWLDPSIISATPDDFEQQMRHLAAHHSVVSVPELVEAYRRGRSLPPRSVMVTFDDAYRDFAEHAWPILNRCRLPVTLFVPTAYPDQASQAFWWDRLHQAVQGTARRDELATPLGALPLATAAQRDRAFRQLREHVKTLPHAQAMAWIDQLADELGAPPPESAVLGWSELRRLASEGVTLCPHTRTHPLMNRISPDEAVAEAVASLEDLQREVGAVPAVFAYPGGALNDEVVRGLSRAGFELAFTTARGLNDLAHAHRLRLRRINVGRNTTQTVLRAQLLPWSVYLNRLPVLGT